MDSHEYSELERASGDKSMGPIVIPYSVFKAITNNFSADQLIGSGGFGVVYKVRAPLGSHLRSQS